MANWREEKRNEITEKTKKALDFAATLPGRSQSELKTVANEAFREWMFGESIDLAMAMEELTDLMAYHGQSL